MSIRSWWIPFVLGAVGPATLVAQAREPIIDMHMHARAGSRTGADGKPVGPPCAPQPCAASKSPVYVGEGAVLRGTLAMMEKYNIVKGFIGDGDADVDVWVGAAPDRFIRSTGIPQNPFDSVLPSLERLREGYRSGRLKGMGEIGTQNMGIAPNDPRLEPYFALAEEFDVPVFVHTAGQGPPIPSYRVAAGRPLLLEDVVQRHPKLRLYFENAGYPFLEDAIALMSQYPQVYADVSTITWIIPRPAFYRYLRALIDAGLGKRLMFGSDQMEWPEVIGRGIEAIESAPFLTAEQKRDILYNNAARFLRLDQRGGRRR